MTELQWSCLGCFFCGGCQSLIRCFTNKRRWWRKKCCGKQVCPLLVVLFRFLLSASLCDCNKWVSQVRGSWKTLQCTWELQDNLLFHNFKLHLFLFSEICYFSGKMLLWQAFVSVLFLSMDLNLLRSKGAVPVSLKVQSSFEGVFVCARVCVQLSVCANQYFLKAT